MIVPTEPDSREHICFSIAEPVSYMAMKLMLGSLFHESETAQR